MSGYFTCTQPSRADQLPQALRVQIIGKCGIRYMDCYIIYQGSMAKPAYGLPQPSRHQMWSSTEAEHGLHGMSACWAKQLDESPLLIERGTLSDCIVLCSP